jgi:hypothetical protein
MNSNGFQIKNNWISHEQSYLKDEGSGTSYPYIEKKDMRMKFLALSIATPLAHLFLSITNVAYRSLRLLSFYHFWKQADGPYSFKARLSDTGKDLFKIIAQPLAFLALEAIAIYGLFSPWDGMKLYHHLEAVQYDRPFLSQLLNFAPIPVPSKDSSIHHHPGRIMPKPAIEDDVVSIDSEDEEIDSASSDSLEEDPIEHLEEEAIPTQSFEELIETIKTADNEKPGFNPKRLADSLMRGMALYVIENLSEGNFDQLFGEALQLIKDKNKDINPQSFRTEVIHRYLIKAAFEEGNTSKIETLAKVKALQNLILTDIEMEINELTMDDLLEFETRYLSILTKLAMVPEEMKEKLSPLLENVQKQIIEEFDTQFAKMIENAERMPLKDNSWENVKTLQNLVSTITSNELFNSITIKLLAHKLPQMSAVYLTKSAGIPNHYSPVLNTYMHAYAISNIKFENLTSFTESMQNLLEHLGDSETKGENDFILEYFVIQLRVIFEKKFTEIKEVADQIELDLTQEAHRSLNADFKRILAEVNHKFSLDIELEIKMKVENDALSALITGVFSEMNSIEIKDWIDTRPETYNLQGFELWLSENWSVIEYLEQKPTTPEGLYNYYVANND